MGKGQIINNFGDGRYAVKLLQNRVKADQALARIDIWIALNQSRQDSLPAGDPEHKLPMLKFSMASLLKQKEYLLLIPQDEIADAWCADLTEKLSGEVGTIEINGDPNAAVNIRPGYTDNAVHVPARDGQTMNIRAMTPEQAFYNLAMMPGWQKWKPTYRIGEITSITDDTCSLRLDDASSSLANSGTGPLNINQARDLTGVGIEYMTCNGSAFESGDRVIVQFIGQDFETPKVIGFEEYPQPCSDELVIIIQNKTGGTAIGTVNYVIEKYRINKLEKSGNNEAVYWETVDLKDGTGLPVPYSNSARRFVVNANSDMNAVIISYTGLGQWGFTFSQPQYGLKQRIPIVKYENCNPYEMPGLYYVLVEDLRSPYQHFLSPGGTCYGAGGIDTNSYSQWLLSSDCTSQRTGSGVNVSDSDRNMSFGCSAPCVYGDRLLLSIYCTPVPNPDPGFIYSKPQHLGYYIGDFTSHQHGTKYWSSMLDFMGRRFLELDQSESWSLNQILYFDQKVFVFFNYDQKINSNSVQIRTYDVITADLIIVKTITGAYNFTRAGFVECFGAKYLYYSTIDTWGTGNCSPIYLADVDSLETIYHITMPFEYFDEEFVMVNMPKTDIILNIHNQIRADHPQQTPDRNYPQCFYLGKSKICKAIAEEHLSWLLSTGRNQHADINGDLVSVRAAKYGVIHASENIGLTIPSEGILADMIYFSNIGWPESPTHLAAMIDLQANQMGWAAGVYPPTITQIISGPGSYNEITHTYSTEETIIDIPLAYRGKVGVQVVVFARG